MDIWQVGAAVGAWTDKCQMTDQFVQCTSLKSNMGHLEASAAAAGLASLALVPLGASFVSANSQLRRLGFCAIE